jgi:hypothetical protein
VKGTADKPKHRATVEVIPPSLVEFEAETAVILQIPRATEASYRLGMFGNRRYDNPIGRTLTREFIRRDPQHTPLIAIRHVPVEDAVRAAWHATVTHEGQTSPASAQAPKGRATPKRPKRKQRDW